MHHLKRIGRVHLIANRLINASPACFLTTVISSAFSWGRRAKADTLGKCEGGAQHISSPVRPHSQVTMHSTTGLQACLGTVDQLGFPRIVRWTTVHL